MIIRRDDRRARENTRSPGTVCSAVFFVWEFFRRVQTKSNHFSDTPKDVVAKEAKVAAGKSTYSSKKNETAATVKDDERRVIDLIRDLKGRQLLQTDFSFCHLYSWNKVVDRRGNVNQPFWKEREGEERSPVLPKFPTFPPREWARSASERTLTFFFRRSSSESSEDFFRARNSRTEIAIALIPG